MINLKKIEIKMLPSRNASVVFTVPPLSRSTRSIPFHFSHPLRGCLPSLSPCSSLSVLPADCFHLPTARDHHVLTHRWWPCSADSSRCSSCWWRCRGSGFAELILSSKRTRYVICKRLDFESEMRSLDFGYWLVNIGWSIVIFWFRCEQKCQ